MLSVKVLPALALVFDTSLIPCRGHVVGEIIRIVHSQQIDGTTRYAIGHVKPASVGPHFFKYHFNNFTITLTKPRRSWRSTYMIRSVR